MKQSRQLIIVVLVLAASSLAIFFIQEWLFRRPDETAFYLLQDMAFLPIQVLLVTLVLNETIARRAKTERLRKMNMVIGAFFSEMGVTLLKEFAVYDRRAAELRAHLLIQAAWTNADYVRVTQDVQQHPFDLRCESGDLAALKTLLLEQRAMPLRLLENPNLLEHETFTDLLWAVNHLTDELWYRHDVLTLTPPDAAHIAGDMRRAYTLLLYEWLAYLKHLRDEYPYIYSLVLRTNPFDPAAMVEVA
ncbi:MAG TPA: hypothetical protein VGM23_17270 [Armatimonadota bacterium]|jgi:hypothetical protein